ncbi:MAG: chloride channel protein, partial [Rhizobiales bacterium]|nr:chloride channel protein [Hyphomicrobiales bacterium]
MCHGQAEHEGKAGRLGADAAAVLLRALLSRLVLDRARLVLRQGLTGLNYDATRLHGLWQLTDQFYLEQPVFAGSALDFHIISQAEAALEGATRDSAMEISVILVAVDNASDRQHVLLDRNVKLVGLEAGYTQLASGIASNIGRRLRLRRPDLRLLVGCGAAAAIAGAFGAPIAG